MKIETVAAQQRTMDSLKYGELLMDAIEQCEKFRDELEQYKMSLDIAKSKKGLSKPEKPQADIRFMGRNIFEHIEIYLKKIRSSELENTLRFLN